MNLMPRIFSIAIGLISLTSFAKADPLSTADLTNLLARIRENRMTQADFQEQRVMRLMTKPIVNSGRVWFQPPNKFRREVKGNSPSVTVSDGRELWIYYPNFKSAERYPLGKGRRSMRFRGDQFRTHPGKTSKPFYVELRSFIVGARAA